MSFKTLRLRAGLTQQQVADAMHTDRSAISLWERGINYPKPARLMELANLLDCTVEELLKPDA